MGKTLQSLCAGNYWEGMAAEADRQLDEIRERYGKLVDSSRRKEEARMAEINELREQGGVIEARLPSTEWFDSVDDVRCLCFDLRDRVIAPEANPPDVDFMGRRRLTDRLDTLEMQMRTHTHRIAIPDTVAVPVETLREWRDALLSTHDILTDNETQQTAAQMAWTAGWITREIAGVHSAIFQFLPEEAAQ